jgi:hypothetical protein
MHAYCFKKHFTSLSSRHFQLTARRAVNEKVGFDQGKLKEVRGMTVTVLPPDGAHGHQSQGPSQESEKLEPARPLLKPQGGGVRILRTPEELSEAINRVREFEQRNAEAMRIRAERHKNTLGGLEHTTIQLNFEIDDSSDDA